MLVFIFLFLHLLLTLTHPTLSLLPHQYPTYSTLSHPNPIALIPHPPNLALTQVRVERQRACVTCKGSGCKDPNAVASKCAQCRGQGVVLARSMFGTVLLFLFMLISPYLILCLYSSLKISDHASVSFAL